MVFAKFSSEKNLYTDYTVGSETAPQGFDVIRENLEGKFFSLFPLSSPVKKNGIIVDIVKGIAPPPPAPGIDPITQIQLAIAELAEAGAQRDIENKLAIAELAEAMTGGK